MTLDMTFENLPPAHQPTLLVDLEQPAHQSRLSSDPAGGSGEHNADAQVNVGGVRD